MFCSGCNGKVATVATLPKVGNRTCWFVLQFLLWNNVCSRTKVFLLGDGATFLLLGTVVAFLFTIGSRRDSFLIGKNGNFVENIKFAFSKSFDARVSCFFGATAHGGTVIIFYV